MLGFLSPTCTPLACRRSTWYFFDGSIRSKTAADRGTQPGVGVLHGGGRSVTRADGSTRGKCNDDRVWADQTKSPFAPPPSPSCDVSMGHVSQSAATHNDRIRIHHVSGDRYPEKGYKGRSTELPPATEPTKGLSRRS